jgi:hypothetical protein
VRRSGFNPVFSERNRISGVGDASRIADCGADEHCHSVRGTSHGSFFERGVEAGPGQSRISSEVLQCNTAKTIVFRAMTGHLQAHFMHFWHAADGFSA